jgi:hypothetical protein
MFSPYAIDLPYEGDEPSGDVSLGDRVAVEPDAALRLELTQAEATAEGYRAQLAAIADGLHERGLVPADLDTDHEGWLAELVFAVIDRQQTGAEASPAAGNDTSAPVVEPGALPRPRKRAPRPRASE